MVQLPVRTQIRPPGPEKTPSWSGWKGLEEMWHRWQSCIGGSRMECRRKLHSSSFFCSFFATLCLILEKPQQKKGCLHTDPLKSLPSCHCRVRIAVSCLVCRAASYHQRDCPPGSRRPFASSKPSEQGLKKLEKADFLNVAFCRGAD